MMARFFVYAYNPRRAKFISGGKGVANPEHLAILEMGVKVWNQWRSENPSIKPDLSKADLSMSDLRLASLRETSLIGVNLDRADLFRADLLKANLSGAIITQANLRRANLIKAVLNGANLINAILTHANLARARIIDAELSRADLRTAILGRARLNNSNLERANLNGAILENAHCYNANMAMVRLRSARLINTKLDGAILTGVQLWEVQNAGWSIKDVVCEYAYWDKIGKEKSVYRSGEFESLFAEKTKIRLLYKDGITPLEISTLPALIKHLGESHPNINLRFVSLREDGGGAVAELAIDDDGSRSKEQLECLAAEIKAEAEQKAQLIRKSLEQENLMLKGGIQVLERQVYAFLSKPTYYLEKGNINMSDTYNVSGQGGAIGRDAHAHDNTFNQIANHLQSVDLAELARQLGELRQLMAERQGSSPQTAIAIGELAKAEIAAQEKKHSKVIEHLKAAGQVALDVAKEVGKAVAVEAIKLSMGAS